jgi:hypothetical protein
MISFYFPPPGLPNFINLYIYIFKPKSLFTNLHILVGFGKDSVGTLEIFRIILYVSWPIGIY